jgi:Protein of unknown function (DUF3038)
MTSDSVSVIPDSDSVVESKPSILEVLPPLPETVRVCSPHVQQNIDLMLLAIEALELGASEKILATARELQLQDIVKSRVELWRLRCTNPWRRSYNRDVLTLEQAKALVILASYRAKEQEKAIRQLLTEEHLMKEKQFPVQNHYLLSVYLDRFDAHFRGRMNARRTKISAYLNSENLLNELALSLLNKLLFCTGTKGMQRFWISLFDGEVA